jgi:hypothetical protein
MALLDIWKKSREQLEGKQVNQVIAFAGNGKLLDGNEASVEFRQFLSAIPSSLLASYSGQCLQEKFEGSGLALQDIINEVGRRLGFEVENGRYRGTPGQSGHDGLWRSKDAGAIVVEVKKTDAYRIDLDNLAKYRHQLSESAKLSEDNSSMLVVVGNEETGDLEAQIRGSRHAWDVRLVSVDALLRLMRLKEDVEDPDMIRRISEVLVPQEFTRIDGIIDLVFSAAAEIRHVEREGEEEPTQAEREPARKPQFVPVKFHDACAERIQAYLDLPLVKQSHAFYASPGGDTSVVCVVSREHRRPRSSTSSFWFAFHPHQRERLVSSKQAFVGFGCGSPKLVLLIPFKTFEAWLEGMNTTHLEGRFYWHVSIFREGKKIVLHRKRGFDKIDLTGFRLRD